MDYHYTMRGVACFVIFFELAMFVFTVAMII